jgi:hypothetical protein
MSEGGSPERLCGAAACGRDLIAKPSLDHLCRAVKLTFDLPAEQRSWAGKL